MEVSLELQRLLAIDSLDSSSIVDNTLITEERVRAQLDNLRTLISFYREYPDLFLDDIKGPGNNFKLYSYQRIILRVAMRHRYTYITLPRGASKSFLSMLILMLRCILYPGANLFVTTGGKEQAASITVSKIEQLCSLVPALDNELNRERGQTKSTSTKDVKYVFKNGSSIDILSATEKSRGQRRIGGLIEECVLVDQTALNEIIIPTTVIDRQLADGTRHPDETINKSQIYITTAGYRNSFAYSKLIELLIQSILQPDEYMILGGTYVIPVLEGLQDADWLDQIKLQDTFNQDSFEREYMSKWTGDAEGAFFSSEKFDKNRVLNIAETEYGKKTGKDAYYALGVDVGRIGCATEITVFKVTPQVASGTIKSLVNIYSSNTDHFEDQAILIKKVFFAFRAQGIGLDANGIGAGLVDFMVKTQIDPETGDILPPFGVMNDEDGLYRKFKTPDTVQDALYLIKANAPFNTEAYSYAQVQMASGRIHFLIDEATAKAKLLSTKVGQNMSPEERNDYLRPYVQTSILREQILNLVETNEGVNIILKQSSRSIPKDKFSSFIYGLYYIKVQEERRKRRRNAKLSDFLLFN